MGKITLLFIPAIIFFSTKTVLDGVYSSEQATRGEAVYEADCIKCHEGSDADGPSLAGRPFIDRWREDNLYVLFDYIKTRMPSNDPGKLSDSAYVDVVAHVLRINGYPSAVKDLSLQDLPAIRLVGKDGPKPLPANTVIQTIGCLDRSADNAWLLNQATDPVRNRQGTEITPDDLKKSAVKPLGEQTFRLQNFTNIRFDFKPDPFNGHKVFVKGVLIRQTNNDRINVTALASIASSCP